jgi:hypothetical protein
MMRGAVLVLFALALALGSVAPAAASQTVPSAGTHFNYTESVLLTNGAGNYSGYTEGTFTNGSISVDSIAANGTDNSSYQQSWTYENNEGQVAANSSSGKFSFSPTSRYYVDGTDGQIGYQDPLVWFYMDNALGNGSTFYVLNSQLTVISTDQPFQYGGSSTGWVKTIYADGTGSYQRNDDYGVFNAVYNWRAYFDPVTGFIVGYAYFENDTDGSGDGFTWVDTLTVTSSSYALTSTAAPPATSTSSSSGLLDEVLGLVVILVIVVVIIAVVVALSRRRRAPMARHSVQGNMSYPPPMYAPPPGLNMNVPQPAVQQIVIRETVKTNCKYCGTLIDTTATVCPKCGAPRT